ncbi:MAG TPA: G1 family glutamic endopeptidase [Mycobacteriales bacterium]|jgi:hypothetical protein
MATALAVLATLSTGSVAATAEPSAAPCGLAGGRAVTPFRTRRDGDGGAFFDYDVAGVIVTAPEPPPGLDLTTAPTDVLERYGLPPRPQDESEGAWIEAMRAFRSTAGAPTHTLCVDGLARPRMRGGAETQCTVSFHDCSNYAGRNATLNSYTTVTANVVIPEVPSANCAGDGHISAWVGIGTELGASGLLQAGTITRRYEGIGNYTYAFYEWVNPPGSGNPSTPPIVSAWNASPGDTMYERVYVNTSTHGVNFFVEDVTTGQHHTATVGGLWADYDPDSAGWIVENHTATDEPNIKTGPWNWTNALLTRYSTTTYGGYTQSTDLLQGVEQGQPDYAMEIVENATPWTSTTSFSTHWYKCRGSG